MKREKKKWEEKLTQRSRRKEIMTPTSTVIIHRMAIITIHLGNSLGLVLGRLVRLVRLVRLFLRVVPRIEKKLNVTDISWLFLLYYIFNHCIQHIRIQIGLFYWFFNVTLFRHVNLLRQVFRFLYSLFLFLFLFL